MRPSGREADAAMRPSRFYPITHDTPKAACSPSSATRACCARPASKTACRSGCAAAVRGWVTGEYGMLPAIDAYALGAREAARGKQGGRTLEIQRLIGRSLRAVIDLEALGERTHHARLRRHPGGRRHANGVDQRRLRGAAIAIQRLHAARSSKAIRCTARSRPSPSASTAATPVLDLDYAEDSEAETDMNIVMNEAGHFIEVQGTAEGHAFTGDEFERDARAGRAGIRHHRRRAERGAAATS